MNLPGTCAADDRRVHSLQYEATREATRLVPVYQTVGGSELVKKSLKKSLRNFSPIFSPLLTSGQPFNSPHTCRLLAWPGASWNGGSRRRLRSCVPRALGKGLCALYEESERGRGIALQRGCKYGVAAVGAQLAVHRVG